MAGRFAASMHILQQLHRGHLRDEDPDGRRESLAVVALTATCVGAEPNNSALITMLCSQCFHPNALITMLRSQCIDHNALIVMLSSQRFAHNTRSPQSFTTNAHTNCSQQSFTTSADSDRSQQYCTTSVHSNPSQQSFTTSPHAHKNLSQQVLITFAPKYFGHGVWLATTFFPRRDSWRAGCPDSLSSPGNPRVTTPFATVCAA